MKVNVRWHDGYFEKFDDVSNEEGVRFGSDLLWFELENGQNRHIPLRSVRWFSVYPGSHEDAGAEPNEGGENGNQ